MERLRDGEASHVDGRLVRVDFTLDRAVAAYRCLLTMELRELHLRTDFGGNEVELATLAAEVRRHGLPPALRRLSVDRWAQWDMPGDDELAHTTAAGREHVRLQLDDPRASCLVVEAFTALLRRVAATAITLQFRARGRTAIDEVLAVLIADPPASLRGLEIACGGRSERDWVQWVAATRVGELLAVCPGLTALTLPMAELELATLEHAALQSLELHWLGGTPLGPSDLREWGPGPVPRASGLEFLRHARLPALTRLAVDFQYTWYVGWLPADLAALCAADLPALTHLELRHCSLVDELCAALPTARWLAQLRVLDLTGTDLSEPHLAALIALRARLTRLTELWCLRPYAVSDAAWDAFTAVYPVTTPP